MAVLRVKNALLLAEVRGNTASSWSEGNSNSNSHSSQPRYAEEHLLKHKGATFHMDTPKLYSMRWRKDEWKISWSDDDFWCDSQCQNLNQTSWNHRSMLPCVNSSDCWRWCNCRGVIFLSHSVYICLHGTVYPSILADNVHPFITSVNPSSDGCSN